MRSSYFAWFAASAITLTLAGCQEDRDAYAIQSRQKTYEAWLQTNRPQLAKIPKSSIQRYTFTTYHSDGEVRPIVDYFVKAGDWDGIINFTFILDIDANRKPMKIHEERITFIGLPARDTVMKSHLENQYFGVNLPPSDHATLIDRLAAGEDFDDLREEANAGDTFVYGTPAANDEWAILRNP